MSIFLTWRSPHRNRFWLTLAAVGGGLLLIPMLFLDDVWPLTWLHRVTVNTAISFLRKPRGRVLPTEPQALDRVAGDSGADPHRAHVGREMVRRLYRVLDTLTPKRRVAYTLFEIEGRSIAEVASCLGVPITVAKSRIWFARREVVKKSAEDEYLGPLIAGLER